MRILRARQAAAFLLVACTILTFVMFVGVNKSVTRDGLSAPAENGGSNSGGGGAVDSRRFRIEPEVGRRAFGGGIEAGKDRRIAGGFVDFFKVVNVLKRGGNNDNGTNNDDNNNKTERRRRRKKMQRYLIEYSPFRDNERLREKYLAVVNSSTGASGSVWFHKEQNDDDGIVAQLGFVPRSYAEKMRRLNMMRFSKVQQGWFEKRLKLERYLKNELKMIRHRGHRAARPARSTPDGLDRGKNSSLGRPDWNDLLKVIYLPDGLPSYDFIGRESLSHEDCPVSACHLTDDPLFEEIAHARLFQNIPMTYDVKPPSQIWILWLLESPVNTFVINDFDMHINWTATFRTDSTIVTPYAKYLHGNADASSSSSSFLPGMSTGASQKNQTQKKKSYATGKSKLVAWFASNCFTTNSRADFVKELAKHVRVDVYGRCGTLDCSKESKEECYEMLSSDYKFYLAFENSNCDSYITEKLFENAFGNNVVPIVMGARREDYERSSPPNSFIHVDDFDTVEDLAKYLKVVDGNDTLYDSYLAWKGQGRFIDTKFWCRLCAMLQDDDKPSMWYGDVESWWKHHGTCRIGRWSRRGAGTENPNDPLRGAELI